MSSRPDPERTPASGWLKLGETPGLCATCGHAKLNETRRGTAYLRCELAARDVSFPRYPRLPVTECTGYEEDHPALRM